MIRSALARIPSHKRPSTSAERLHVVWLHDSARATGGCEQYMINTVRHLRPHGVTSTLVYGDAGDGPLDMLPHFDQAFPLVDLEHQLRTIAPDLVFAHRIPGCDTLRTMAESGIPSLRFFHDHKLFCPREHKYTVIGKQTCSRAVGPACFACLGVVNRSSRWPGIRLRLPTELRAELRAHDALDGYVVGSAYMARHLLDHGFAADKTHVLRLYTDPQSMTGASQRDSKLLVFAGQVVRGKGLDTLLEALCLTPSDVRLQVAGTGAQLDECKRLADRLNLRNRVEFLGKLSPDQLVERYQKAASVVVPSRSPETFGQVGIEAMSHGTPVIATNVGGMNEWLQDGTTGLFASPNNAGSLAAAIEQMTSNFDEANRMGKAARELVKQRFLPQHHTDELVDLFQQVVSEKKVQ